MKVSAFADIEKDFLARVRQIVWCNVATVDRRGRPRSRILHPIWEGRTGWILTGRHTLKTRHLAANPHVSLCYASGDLQQVYVDCRVEWADDPADKARLWDLFASIPPPVGYDPAIKRYPYDPKKARELLAKAGYPNGLEVKLYLAPDRHLQRRSGRLRRHRRSGSQS